MKILPQSPLRRKPGAQGSPLGDDFIVLDADGKMLRGFNSSAAWLWEKLEGEKSVEQLSLELASKCQITFERASEDVTAFFEMLLQKDLIEVVSAEAST